MDVALNVDSCTQVITCKERIEHINGNLRQNVAQICTKQIPVNVITKKSDQDVNQL